MRLWAFKRTSQSARSQATPCSHVLSEAQEGIDKHHVDENSQPYEPQMALTVGIKTSSEFSQVAME